MRSVILCFVVMSVCSCHQAVDNQRSGQLDARALGNSELERLLNEFFRASSSLYVERDWLFRGPLTAAQVKEELVTLDKSHAQCRLQFGPSEEFAGTEEKPRWSDFMSNSEDDDTLYFFVTAPGSWARSGGQAGYFRMREGRVVDAILTYID